MGHYSEHYEAQDRANAAWKIKKAAKDYAEVKEHLEAVSSFVAEQAGWGENQKYPEMKQAYKLLQGTIDTWRMNEGLLVSNPKILLDKLKDD